MCPCSLSLDECGSVFFFVCVFTIEGTKRNCGVITEPFETDLKKSWFFFLYPIFSVRQDKLLLILQEKKRGH